MATKYLYRGVNAELYASLKGELRPKQYTAFSRSPEFGRDEWGNCYWGDTPLNAVVEHQRNQAGYPTSGISSTPHLEIARSYATFGGKDGYIYVIDQEKCHEHGVTLYVVNDLVPQPAKREDDEIILVAQDFGSLPSAIITGLLEVRYQTN